jgi:hypothetical protein
MKKFFAILLFIAVNKMNYAQYYYLGTYYNESIVIKKETHFNKENKIAEKVEIITDFKKNRKTHISAWYIYDSLGRRNHSLEYKSNGKIKFNTQITYKNDTSLKITSYKRVKNNKISFWQENKYNSFGKRTEVIYKGKDAKELQRTVYEYNNKALIKTSTYLKSKLQNYTVYSYYSDGNKKEIKVYKSNGKISKVYSYKCSDEGKSIKHKDTSNVCRIEDHSADGLKTVSYLWTNEKGQVTRSVYKYKNDSIFISHSDYDKNDILSSELIYDYKEGVLTEIHRRYYKKGILNYSADSKYNSDNLVISSSIKYKNNDQVEKIYNYDNNGLIKTKEEYKNGILKTKYEYLYRYY